MLLKASMLFALLAVSNPALADPKPMLLTCQSEDDENFTIELFSRTSFGPMHCIKGLLIVDMTPCAPDGGWGLSYPTGRANISETTQLWAIAARHFGGKFTATLGPEEFSATAVWGNGLEPNLENGSYDMTLKLNRINGLGEYISGELGTKRFACEEAKRKF